jgi:hypothetical protein
MATRRSAGTDEACRCFTRCVDAAMRKADEDGRGEGADDL